METGLDEPLAKHFAHLYIRDPLVIFSDKIDQNDELSSDHFEVSGPQTRKVPSHIKSRAFNRPIGKP